MIFLSINSSLRTELGDVLQHSDSRALSDLLHLTDLLPGVAGAVVLQDVTQKRLIR